MQEISIFSARAAGEGIWTIGDIPVVE